MSREFLYRVELTPDPDGGVVITVPDLPEVITQADQPEDALAQAADALEEAVAGRIRRNEEIPLPSPHEPGQPRVHVPALSAAKAALYLALRESGLTKTQLASRQ